MATINRAAIILLLFLTFCLFFQYGESSEMDSEIQNLDIQDCKMMMIFTDFYEGSPFLKWESAAWIVVNSQGQFDTIYWPHVPQEGKQFWTDSLPANVIALVHTHPVDLDPRPSQQDKSEAQRLKISIFTLTRNGIWIVTPAKICKQIAGPHWFENTKQGCTFSILNSPKHLEY